jgi:hypothetical protein
MLPADVVRTVMEAIETVVLETTDVYLAEDLKVTGLLKEPVGKARFLELMAVLLNAAPNWSFNAANLRESGETVRATVRITGTNTGAIHLPSLGVERQRPTGKRFALSEEQQEYVVKENKIVSMRMGRIPDGVMPQIIKQLGVGAPVKAGV